MVADRYEATTDTEPLLILFGSGAQCYREYLLRSASAVRPLWLFAATEPSWQRPYLAGYTVVDTLCAEESCRAAVELAAHRAIDGLLCYDEVRLSQAAEVAAAVGVPASPPPAVAACRDKRRSRELLAAAGVPQARSICVADLGQAARAADEIGYPLIVKPRGLAGSEGVGLVAGPGELAGKVAAALRADFTEVPRFTDGLLVEEYLDGPEISVDCVVRSGLVTPLYLAHKQLDMPGTFEETGHVVTADDPLLTEAGVRDVLARAHAAVGFDHGMTHVELRLTATGPRVVEVNGRLGGDFIPYLGWLASGIDPGVVAATLAVGEDPDLTPRRRATAAVRFLYPDRDVRLTAVDIDPAALPPGVWLVEVVAEAGRELRLPPRAYVSGRAAAAFAWGSDEKACRTTLDRVGGAVTVRGEPLPTGRVPR